VRTSGVNKYRAATAQHAHSHRLRCIYTRGPQPNVPNKRDLLVVWLLVVCGWRNRCWADACLKRGGGRKITGLDAREVVVPSDLVWLAVLQKVRTRGRGRMASGAYPSC